MSDFCKYLGGGVFDTKLYPAQGENCYPYTPSVPEHTEQQIVITKGFKWLVENESATGIYEVKDIPPDPATIKNYSVPDLFFWAYQRDLASQVDALLESAGVYTVAITTKVVSSANPMFEPILTQVKEQLGLTDADIAEALAYAETDKEPDEVS